MGVARKEQEEARNHPIVGEKARGFSWEEAFGWREGGFTGEWTARCPEITRRWTRIKG
jgi:hypothetical protein